LVRYGRVDVRRALLLRLAGRQRRDPAQTTAQIGVLLFQHRGAVARLRELTLQRGDPAIVAMRRGWRRLGSGGFQRRHDCRQVHLRQRARRGDALPARRRARAVPRWPQLTTGQLTLTVTAQIPAQIPALIAAAGERASMRFLEFFAADIRNPHTRRAYARAAEEFLAWCAVVGVPSIGGRAVGARCHLNRSVDARARGAEIVLRDEGLSRCVRDASGATLMSAHPASTASPILRICGDGEGCRSRQGRRRAARGYRAQVQQAPRR